MVVIIAGGLRRLRVRPAEAVWSSVGKWMMSALLVLILVLVVHSFTLPGAGEGLAFYLLPRLVPRHRSRAWATSSRRP